MELKRTFYDFLVAWKATARRECLLVKGARQIGKTFIIRKFGRENFENFVEINFALNPEYRAAFDGNLTVRAIVESLTAIGGDLGLVPGRTLLFLDEIQDCPNARTALKAFAEDGSFTVVASGSLLGIKYKKGRLEKTPRSIPVGYERQVTMYSLSFEEYLMARGRGEKAIADLRRYFTRREIVPGPMHEAYTKLLREYIVIGGMPEVVSAFVDHGNYGEVQVLQEKLVADYVDDIGKYADTADIPKVERCFAAIPRILAKENRKFKYAEVEPRGTARKYLSSVDWLKDARMATLAECVNVALPGLAGYVKEEWFKLYSSDVGLLASFYGLLVKRGILDGTLRGSVKGGLYENLVAGILERNGFPIRYYRNDDREVEFLLEQDEGVVPVEVKAGNAATVSLDELLRQDAVPFGYKFIDGNVGVVGKKITMPHYLAMFLRPVNQGM